MARTDISSGWDKIRENVQETERLMGQKKYNQSMIKARQTVEYMVKLQCDQAGIVESSMDAMIHALYNDGWISKSTAEHYAQIYEIGTKAAKNGDNGAYNANQAYHVLSQEIYSFADNAKPVRGKRPAGSRTSQSGRRSGEGSGSGLQPSDLLKFVVPIVLVIILIVLIRVLTPKKSATEETSAPVITTEALETETTEEETETSSSGSVYKTTTTLNVRKEPSTDADRIGKLDPGAAVEYLRDYDDTWAVIKYNGQEAYVSKEYLTLD